MSATIEVSRTTLEAMAEILKHVLDRQPAVSPHPAASEVHDPARPTHRLRDVVAACVLQGVWASGRLDPDDFKQCQGIARMAYHQADCMLWQAKRGVPAPASGGIAA